MTPTTVSIIICTRNRSASLRDTLECLAALPVPAEYSVELVVVDNGSTDDTVAIANSVTIGNMNRIVVLEPKPGQSRARNAGLQASTGSIIVFTDDDVRPDREWIRVMCDPIRLGRADAVAGGVVNAPELSRPWLDAQHQTWLAATAGIDPEEPERMVGANMSFSRRVLDKVPGFDEELGPGARGFADDTLFSRQLKAAGYTITSAFDHPVVHYFQPERLTRSSIADAAHRRGLTEAYMAYHWEHSAPRFPRVRMARKWLQLALLRAKRGASKEEDGMPSDEMYHRMFYHFYAALPAEMRRRPLYDRFGLTKRA